MRKISKEKLNKVLDDHKHWICEDCDDWEHMKADLSDVDLSGVDLSDANLRCADLRGADLSNTDLSDANLICADLRGADLSNTDLSDANLRCADLRYANLSGADLRYAMNVPFIPYICPEKGSFIGYKKANSYIIELLITDDALRSSATSRICRCSKAKIVSITTLDGINDGTTEVRSNYDSNFIYKVGKIVEEPNFCEDRWRECAPGIHFFINRQEAVNYL